MSTDDPPARSAADRRGRSRDRARHWPPQRDALASTPASELASGVTTLTGSISGIAQRVKLGLEARSLSRTGDGAIADLSGRAVDISDFTGRIQAIASQTRLLALNATIEAAAPARRSAASRSSRRR